MLLLELATLPDKEQSASLSKLIVSSLSLSQDMVFLRNVWKHYSVHRPEHRKTWKARDHNPLKFARMVMFDFLVAEVVLYNTHPESSNQAE